jgi:hypothetical protein
MGMGDEALCQQSKVDYIHFAPVGLIHLLELVAAPLYEGRVAVQRYIWGKGCVNVPADSYEKSTRPQEGEQEKW